jgi:hypothetical protein
MSVRASNPTRQNIFKLTTTLPIIGTHSFFVFQGDEHECWSAVLGFWASVFRFLLQSSMKRRKSKVLLSYALSVLGLAPLWRAYVKNTISWHSSSSDAKNFWNRFASRLRSLKVVYLICRGFYGNQFFWGGGGGRICHLLPHMPFFFFSSGIAWCCEQKSICEWINEIHSELPFYFQKRNIRDVTTFLTENCLLSLFPLSKKDS